VDKDPAHWLYRLSAREWIQASLAELQRAEAAYRNLNPKAGHAGARRAAGMALNAALIYEPRPTWGRSYMDHLAALPDDDTAPPPVRDAARLLLETPAPGAPLVALRSKSSDERLLEAARTVMAHGYAVVTRHEGAETQPAPEVEEIPPAPPEEDEGLS
jgi:HEPN domain-containing protein